MSDARRGQVGRSAADIYEEFFLPALFRQWAGPVADAAGVGRGHRVLDVACGTGVLGREAAARVGRSGSVVGLDPNEGMLAVAERKAPEIDWRKGTAESIPFDAEEFDAVVSQFGLMFFDDRPTAIREMLRVLKPGGRLAVAVWDGLDSTPGYLEVTGLLEELFGKPAADALRAPFVLGETAPLRALFEEAGASDVRLETLPGTARFDSLADWMHTDVRGWTLSDMIDDAQYARLLEAARTRLRRFVMSDGTVCFDAPAHIVTAGTAGKP